MYSVNYPKIINSKDSALIAYELNEYLMTISKIQNLNKITYRLSNM